MSKYPESLSRNADPPADPSKSSDLVATPASSGPKNAPGGPTAPAARRVVQDATGTPPTAPTAPTAPNPLATAVRVPKAKRDRFGRLLPGQTANPFGRSKGVAAMAKYIMETVGHEQLVDYAVDIWQNRSQATGPDGEPLYDLETGEPIYVPANYSHAERVQMHSWLAERGYGKPVIAVDIQAMVASTSADEREQLVQAFDLGNMSDDEQEVFARILARSLGQADPLAGSARRALDVPVVEVVREPDSTSGKPDSTGTDNCAETKPSEVKQSDAIVSENRTVREPDIVVDETLPEPASPVTAFAHTFPSSSNIVGFSLDEQTLRLTVTFKGGRQYEHRNVSRALCDDWIKHPSAGQWYAQILRANPERYPVRAIARDA